MRDKFIDTLKKINPWHYLWISLVLSEVFTSIMNVTMGYIMWGRIDYDLLFIGCVDALIVSLIVASITIYFLKYTARVAETNELLKKEIAERKQIEEALENSEKRLKILFDYAPDATFLLDLKGNILDGNIAAEKMSGYTKEEIVGRNVIEEKLIPLSQVPKALNNLAKGALGSPIGPEEYTILRRDGTHVEVELSGYPVKIDHTLQVLCVTRDITERKSLEVKLHDLAITDELTGLYNRRGFFTLAVQHIKLANRNKRGIFMLYADLDGLKMINDKFGHKTGDLALIDLANLLKKSYRESDIIARIGGDEFVVIPAGTAGDTVEIITHRFQKILMMHNEEIKRNYNLSASAGIAYYDPEKPSSLDELLIQADEMMYEQKRHKQKS